MLFLSCFVLENHSPYRFILKTQNAYLSNHFWSPCSDKVAFVPTRRFYPNKQRRVNFVEVNVTSTLSWFQVPTMRHAIVLELVSFALVGRLYIVHAGSLNVYN